MVYVYCLFISVGTVILSWVGLFLILRWTLPRYGAAAMRAAMSGMAPTRAPRPPSRTV